MTDFDVFFFIQQSRMKIIIKIFKRCHYIRTEGVIIIHFGSVLIKKYQTKNCKNIPKCGTLCLFCVDKAPDEGITGQLAVDNHQVVKTNLGQYIPRGTYQDCR